MNQSEFFSIALFLIVLAILLLLDLGVFNKKKEEPKFGESLLRTGVWVFLALLFFVFLWFSGSTLHGIQDVRGLNDVISRYGERISNPNLPFTQQLERFNHNLALSFLNGYLVEYSLSMDNILVIILIFAGFKVQRRYYHKVLFWGIIGAVLMRALFILLGTTLIQHFEWVLYVFGAFLIFSGGSLWWKRNEEEKIEPETNGVVIFLSRWFPVEKRFHGDRFFLKIDQKTWMTPLFLVLMVIEFSDLIFAVDSIPAVFSITRNPYVVFFSNIFAIMGLRSLFFLMEGIVDRFHYLKSGLALLLILVGFKMVFPAWFMRIGFNNTISLITILTILGGSILLSIWIPKKGKGN